MTISFTDRADDDVQDAFDHYRGKSDTLALEFLDRVEDAVKQINDHPLRYAPLVQDARKCRLEQFPYSLWYVVRDEITIFACWHAKRDDASVRARLNEPKAP